MGRRTRKTVVDLTLSDEDEDDEENEADKKEAKKDKKVKEVKKDSGSSGHFRPENWARKCADRDYKLKSTLELEKKLKEFKSCREPEPFIIKCLEKRIIDEITCNYLVLSGSVVQRGKMRRLIRGLDIGSADPDLVEEMYALRRATELVFSTANEGTPLTEEFIKKIHAIIMTDMYDGGGKYREKRVMLPACPKEPAKPEDIERRLRELLSSELVYDKSIPIWSRVERFHLEFEDIHPFDRGNGRVGALLIAYQLMSEGYPPAEILFEDCVDYFHAFDVFYLYENETPMRNFFTLIIERGVDTYLDVYHRYNENLRTMKRLNRRKCRKIASR